MRSALFVSLAFVAACSSDPECSDDQCSTETTGTTSGATTSGVTASVTSTTVSTGSTSASSAASTSASTGSGGGGGTGGSGGGGIWMEPTCASVNGTSAVTFSLDDGLTAAPNVPAPLSGVSYTFGVAALDTPNTVIADNAGHVLVSTDAGCTFTDAGTTGFPSAHLTAGKDGEAYGFVDNDLGLYRYDGSITPLTSPAANIVGLGVDLMVGKKLRILDAGGQIYESTNSGTTFNAVGSPCPSNGLLYRGAFDPMDLDHVICAMASDGVYTTFDGGVQWTQSTGLPNNWNPFNAAVSPVDGDVVWAEGLLLGPDTRHLFLSHDGGLTFEPVFDATPDVVLFNGNPLWPDPVDANILRFEFGSSFQAYGTDLYRYDDTTGMVTLHHYAYDKVAALAFSPANPLVLYLGISSEDITVAP